MAAKKGLGKGLGALLSIYDEEIENEIEESKVESGTKVKTAESKKEKSQNGVMELAISEIYANPNQPRKNFNEEALNELATSIKTHGVIQPIIVNKTDFGYMIIAGERRYRASKIAGLTNVPCVIKYYSEKQVKEIAIIENLQREDLNPIETAKAIKQLMDEYNFTHEIVAERIGISRSNITNTLRLLNLYPEVMKMVEENRISAGHGRCLVAIDDEKAQIKLANAVIDKNLSVRELENIIKKLNNKANEKPVEKPQQSIELVELITNMERAFATKVSAVGSDEKGRIYIDYFSRDDLDRICEILELVNSKKLTLKELSDFNKRK